jgi:hypothetical protein
VGFEHRLSVGCVAGVHADHITIWTIVGRGGAASMCLPSLPFV